ncbi:hypothetical protein WBG78_23235 [Chryseolinea sp. T2]|uniref:hypothetical protein n=1 Tax=Chryseolinea sp. T2 TaxID=3129255 RepID=UPI003077423A
MRLKTIGLIGLLTIGCSRAADKGSISGSQPTADQLENSIDGVWTDGSGPNASFSIENDSTIYDIEHFTTARFVRQKDSATFYYPDDTLKVRIYRIHEDTLIYEYEGQKTKYWRFWEENNS